MLPSRLLAIVSAAAAVYGYSQFGERSMSLATRNTSTDGLQNIVRSHYLFFFKPSKAK
jgi:hypothetical protein